MLYQTYYYHIPKPLIKHLWNKMLVGVLVYRILKQLPLLVYNWECHPGSHYWNYPPGGLSWIKSLQLF